MRVGDPVHHLDYVILGGGILGTTLAALASLAGRRVLVLRLKDDVAPMADTLRNQGWLQSGLMYSRGRYPSIDAYMLGVRSAFLNGPRLLKMCEMTPSSDRGILKVTDQERIEDLVHKAKVLRLKDDQFREVGFQEAREQIGELAEPNSKYFMIPDTPFDEAGIMTYLRSVAIEHGAMFWALEKPAEIAPQERGLQIMCDGEVIISPLTFIAAGAGTVKCFNQISSDSAPFDLQHTPLMVHHGPSDETASVFVDLDRGFSSVRHQLNGSGKYAFVTGTRVNHRDAHRDPYTSRKIRSCRIDEFKQSLHPSMQEKVDTARFTGGCELIPQNLPLVEPWLREMGSVVFGNPGRATVALPAAQDAYIKMEEKLSELGASRLDYAPNGRTAWEAPVRMHFVPAYTFDDADR